VTCDVCRVSQLGKFSLQIEMSMSNQPSRWGTWCPVVRAGELDGNTPQTLGMQRRSAITYAAYRACAVGGKVTIDADAKTGAHHHGDSKASFMW